MFQRRLSRTRFAVLVALMTVTVVPSSRAAEPGVAEDLVALYVPMQEALAGDSIEGVKKQAAAIASKASAAAGSPEGKARFGPVIAAAQGMTAADIEGLREQFKPLSLALAQLVEKTEVAGHGIYFCPMADGYWIQKTGEIRNPYFGKEMLTCGERVSKVGA
jgi:membrane fusion protein, copper/silver efflux system